MQATSGLAPSWLKLIESGIERAKNFAPLSTWEAFARERLNANNAEAWIAVADEVTNYLGGSEGGEFRRWLADQFKALTVEDRALLDSLASLGCPIATTNYDDVLSGTLGLPVINWTDPDEVALFLKGESAGVLHLHGHWRKPETVILGRKSYDTLISDTRRKLLQQLSTMTRPSVFVGCGADGMSDPDSEQLDAFLWEWRSSAERRFWLVRGTALEAKQMSKQDRNLLAVSYGMQFSELPEFIAKLAAVTGRSTPVLVQSQLRTIDIYEPEPKIFGRDAQRDAIVGNLLNAEHVVISGAPGAGKTALAVAALYDARIRAKFGGGRLFVSLEGMEDARSIAASLADAMGLVASVDVPSLLRQIDLHSRQSPIVAILDNAEGVFENDYHESERVLNLLAQCASVTLIITLRGAVPKLAGSHSIDDLAKLELEDARRAFLDISGTRFANDAHLDPLLIALDGHPLSIQLIAAQARALQRLQPLLESWEDERANILRVRGQNEQRLTSVRASLALSLKTSTLQKEPFAKRLLGALELLPDGIEEDQVRDILGERSTLPRAKVIQAIAVVRELKLVEGRIDSRLRMLNPLRESLIGLLPQNHQDRTRIMKRGWALATKGRLALTEKWPAARRELDLEINNIDVSCRLGLAIRTTEGAFIDALNGYANYLDNSRSSTTNTLHEAVAHLIEQGKFDQASYLVFLLGSIAFERNKHLEAKELYKKALVYVGNNRGNKSHILTGLGRIELYESNHVLAEKLLCEARDLVSDGFARTSYGNSLVTLSDLALRRANISLTLDLVEKAINVFSKTGDSIGEANCLAIRGHVGRSEQDLRKAVAILEKIGAPASLSFAQERLGNHLHQHGNSREALVWYEKGQLTAQNGGVIGNEASALIHQGMCRRLLGAPEDQVRELIELGFRLWFQLLLTSNPAYLGWQALYQALIGENPADKERMLREAEARWTTIERYDLVRDWIYFDQAEWPAFAPSPRRPSATPR